MMKLQIAIVALASCSALVAGSDETAASSLTRQALVEEWKGRTGYARVDLNNIQILPDFQLTRDFDAADTIPRGSKISVRSVDVADDRRCIDVDVKEADTRRWTEVHLVLGQPIGSTFSVEQVAQLNAMWARLISPEPEPGIAAEDDAQATSAAQGAHATVHIYRPKKVTGGGVGHSIACDWLDIGLLENGRYFTVVLPPGTHEFFATSRSSERVSLSLQAGREYYLRDFIAWAGVELEVTPPDEAAAAIRKLKYADLDDIRDRRNVRTEAAK